MFERHSMEREQTSFAVQRARMVEEQLRRRGIQDERLLAAMGRVPREVFVAPDVSGEAYEDKPLPIGENQTISQPYMVAAMVRALAVQPQDRILEVGTGTGYEAAVLGELATEVWTIERYAELAARATENLKVLGYENVHVIHGDGSVGLPALAPFDGILVAAAAPHIPESLLVQLAEGGRMVVPVGGRHEQQLQIVRKVGGEVITRSQEYCRFVPLVGEEGWSG